MWPCGGGWTRGDDLRSHVNNKVPQDDAGLYMRVGKDAKFTFMWVLR